MKKLGVIVLACAFLLNVSCAKRVPKIWSSNGGSRADATVQIAYTYNPEYEIPDPDVVQGRELAESKCKNWGYMDATPFGMYQQKCNRSVYNPFIQATQCIEIIVMQEYQCIGRGDKETPLENLPHDKKS